MTEVDPSDYRFGQEPIVGPGAPDTRPPVARIVAKADGVFRKPAPYRRRLRLGFPDADHVIEQIRKGER